MPKIITDTKREETKKKIKYKTEQLIYDIGIKNITISKICDFVPIGKGTFYYYYESKEILLYEIIEEKENILMNRIIEYSNYNLSKKEKIAKALMEVYIGENSIVGIITTEEIEKIIAKLPEEIIVAKKDKGKNFYESIMQLFKMDFEKINMGVVAELLDCIHFVASNPSKHGGNAKKEALRILIFEIATYMTKEGFDKNA